MFGGPDWYLVLVFPPEGATHPAVTSLKMIKTLVSESESEKKKKRSEVYLYKFQCSDQYNANFCINNTSIMKITWVASIMRSISQKHSEIMRWILNKLIGKAKHVKKISSGEYQISSLIKNSAQIKL